MRSKCQPSPYVHHTLTLPPALPSDAPVTISTLLHPSMIALLPNPLPTAQKPIQDPPFKVIKTPDRGRGMFASRAIEAGSLITIEHPLFIIPVMPLPRDTGFELYEQVGQRIPQTSYDAVIKLANCRSAEECASMIEGVARTNALNLELRFPDTSDSDDSFEGGRHYGGTFLNIGARNNHSCGPNAAYRWDLASLSATLYALRDIAAGEEITITYTDPLQARVDRMKKLEPDYRFTCDCSWCSFSDPLDQEKSDNTRTYLKTYLSTRPSYKKWSRDLCLPDKFVIDSHEVVVPMIIQEGLHALLPIFFEEIMWCYLELGDEAWFKVYLEKTLSLAMNSKPSLALLLQGLRQDPTADRGWRSRVKAKQQANQGRKRVDVEFDDLGFGNMFGCSDTE